MIALGLAVIAAGVGQTVLAIVLALIAAAFAVSSRHALRLAARSRVGAESEAQVRRALEPLRREGWRVQHALDWPGGGDLDHVVRAPSGVGFVIETKTLRYTRAHRARTVAAARRLARRRRRYRCGVRPVICLARARGVERIEGEVLVMSLDRLVPALRQPWCGAVGSLPERRTVRMLRRGCAASFTVLVPLSLPSKARRKQGRSLRTGG